MAMAKTKIKCNICGRILSNSNKLVEHIKREHSSLSEKSIQYLQNIGVDIDRQRKG